MQNGRADSRVERPIELSLQKINITLSSSSENDFSPDMNYKKAIDKSTMVGS